MMESAEGIMSSTIGNGFLCPHCGSWAAGTGIGHVCIGGNSSPQQAEQYSTMYWITPPIQDEILAQLTRIAQALETIAEKMKAEA